MLNSFLQKEGLRDWGLKTIGQDPFMKLSRRFMIASIKFRNTIT